MSRFIIVVDVWVLLPKKHYGYTLAHIKDKERIQNKAFETEKDALYYKNKYMNKFGFSNDLLEVREI